jgi:hypothetical protein
MNHLTWAPKSLRRAALAAALTLFGQGATASAQKEPEPVPKDQSGELRQPKPLIPRPIDSAATLPPGNKMAFALDVGSKAQTGNWDVNGKVIENAGGRLTIKANTGDEWHLLYRLPQGQELNVTPGQSVTIKRVQNIIGSRLAYDLHISSGDDLILAASRQYRTTAPKDAEGASRLSAAEGMAPAPLRSIAFWGDAERREALKPTKFTTVYKVPIKVQSLLPGQANSGVKSLAHGESASLDVDNKSFTIAVTESREVVPKPEFKGVVEGSGYTLEYVISKKRQ